MDRFEKLDWLYETCGEGFIHEVLPLEMARWMGEDDFSKFYEHLCRMWQIARTPEEAEELANS